MNRVSLPLFDSLVCSLSFTCHLLLLLLLLFFIFLLSQYLANLYPPPDCNFQEVQVGYKCYARLGAQIYPSLRDIYALRRVAKGFSPDPRLCAFLYKLPGFVEGSDSRQPIVVISGRSATWVLATRAHFRGSQALRSPIGQTQLPQTYTRRFGG